MPKIERNSYGNDINFMKSENMVAFTTTALEENANAEGLVIAGTIVPANDATAEGIAFNTVESGQPLSMVVQGHVIADALPIAPTPEAIEALKMIKFH